MSKSPASRVRVRFAPSPTGYLHVGGARTALYNYLFAKHHKGQFVLRVEDTDTARSTDESMKKQLEDLKWLGLDWDEGVEFTTFKDKGSYGPYRQSLRKEIYQKHAQKLIDKGLAYYCFLTDEQTQSLREQVKENKTGGQHIQSPYRDQPLSEALKKMDQGERPTVRFKTPNDSSEIVLNDLIRGEVRFPSDMVGDFVILRSGGMPVYNFCCVVDDALMKISHVFRAEEHLNNTIRQLMLYKAFDYPIPEFGHLSIILGPDKQKLSKRNGATSCYEYNQRGFLPEALNNFIALLGWSPKSEEEILSLKKMTDEFSTDRLIPSPAVFDEVKLKWMNGVHLRALSDEELWKRLDPLFKKHDIQIAGDEHFRKKVLNAFRSKMEVLEDCVELFKPLSDRSFSIGEKAQEVFGWEKAVELWKAWRVCLESLDGNYMSEDDFSKTIKDLQQQVGVKGKELFMPLRVAIIGEPHGADVKKLVPLLLKTSLLERVDKCLNSENV